MREIYINLADFNIYPIYYLVCTWYQTRTGGIRYHVAHRGYHLQYNNFSLAFAFVKIRPRKACRYPNLRSFGWVSYDKVGGLYSGKLGIRTEARASDLRSYPGLWWKRIKLHLYEGTKVSTLRGPTQLADLQGALCVPTY